MSKKNANFRTLTIVVKLGTSSICDEVTHEPRIANMSLISETVVKLKRQGHRVIIVSSAAIAVGLHRMGLDKRPKHLATTQAVAAIGQCRLMSYWDDFFRLLNQPIAQILISRNDIADRQAYLNAVNTLTELLNMGVIPIVNENDTLSVKEIKFGDNDTLSAVTAGMISADYLFLMTDVDCLYTANPRLDPNAKPIKVVHDISKIKADVSSAGSDVGTGGMTTKLIAAELATSVGVTTIITRSSLPGNIHAILNHLERSKVKSRQQSENNSALNTPNFSDSDSSSSSSSSSSPSLSIATKSKNKKSLSSTNKKNPSSEEANLSPTIPEIIPAFTPLHPQLIRKDTIPLHTMFEPTEHTIRDKYFWILNGRKPKGTIFIDKGAANAITGKNKAGLFPAGIVAVQGIFHDNDPVNLVEVDSSFNKSTVSARSTTDLSSLSISSEQDFNIIGIAIVNYSSTEISKIMGLQSSQLQDVLGYSDTEYVAHRDNIAVF